MKLNKIFAIALAALAMTACSDDDNDLNTSSGVTVQMQKTSVEARENSKNPFNVPIEVTGEANGPIVVYVETTPTGTIPAIDDENYLVTSKRIIIPAGETSAAVEICAVNDDEETIDPRTFNVTITKVEGATIGSLATTLVSLRDDEADPYERMTGSWTMKCETVIRNGVDGPFTLSMETPDPEEDAEYYGHELYGYGLQGDKDLFVTLNFSYNEITDVTKLSIQTGGLATTTLINFGFIGVVIGSSQYPPDGVNFGPEIPLTYGVDEAAGVEYWEADPDALYLLAAVPYPELNFLAGYMDGWRGIRFERPLR